MKLKNFEIYSYENPLKGQSLRKGFFIQLLDDNGRKGVGEIAPLPGWSQETYQETLVILKNLRLKFLKGDLSPIYLPPSVMFGMECAIWQLQNTMSSDFSFQLSSKVKLGDLDLDSAIIKATELIKNKGPIKVDLNRKWELEKTLEFAKHFRSEQFVYIEEPAKNFTDLEKFYEETNIPYAVDESILYHPLERVLSLKGLSYIVIKPMLHGGLSKCREIITKAKKIPAILSSTYESAIGLSHIVNISRVLLPNTPIGIDTMHLLKHSFASTSTTLNKGILKKSWFNEMLLQHSLLEEIV